MQILTPEEQRQLQEELGPDESLLWSGKPNIHVVFHASDWYMIPFSLMWGGFAIFWEAGVTGFGKGTSAPSFFMLWGVPFVLIGQYFIWGRFFYAAWKKKRLLYAIATRRVLVLVLAPGKKIVSSFIESIPVVDTEFRSDGIGTIKFGTIGTLWGSNRSNGTSMDGLYLNSGVPVFVDVDDAASVYATIARLRSNLATR
jgi:hypothetical protein